MTFRTILEAVAALLGPITGWLAFRGWQNPEPEAENAPPAPPQPSTSPANPSPMPDTIPESETPQEAVYRVADSLLGRHLSLNDSVAPETGCAEAVSFILKNCGYPIPQGGIATVAGLTEWMLNTAGFTPIVAYEKGCVITGRNGADAHIGICGNTDIMSNTSYSDPSKELVKGLWQANFKRENWGKVYQQVRYFRPAKVVS